MTRSPHSAALSFTETQESGTAESTSNTVVDLKNLRKVFGKTVALRDVSFSVPSGEIVALLGLSGSGKSTLLRHLNGLEMPTSGTVRVLENDVPSLQGRRLRNLRRRIGFVFQQFELVGQLTVLENVVTGSLGTLRGPRLGLLTYPKALRMHAFDLLEEVGLAAQAYQRADTLSGGQQQRVAIARALMQSPDMLLADEPVASLDPETSDQVMTLLRQLAMRRDLTVLCSLHQVDLALSWADRIIGLRHGEVVLDTKVEGIDKAKVMEIYGRVATSTSELQGVALELAATRVELEREREGATGPARTGDQE